MDRLSALCTSLISPFFPLHSRVHKMQKEELYIKRDDELGFSTSGSKIRKYASLLPFLEKQTKPIAVVGSPYSNHVLSLVQLLKQAGISYHLFLEKPGSTAIEGNYFFLSLLIKEEEFTWIEDSKTFDNDAFFCIPLGACMKESLPGALTLAVDILENENKLNLLFNHIFIDSGTGVSAIGLILAFTYLKLDKKIHVVLIAGTEESFTQELSLFKSHLESLLGEEIATPSNYELLFPITAKSFGSCNKKVLREIVETAKNEGFFLDPIYTAKLLMTTKEAIKKESLEGKILWIHSGGALSLSGFKETLRSL